MRQKTLSGAGMIGFLCFIALNTLSQTSLNIWPGKAPGSENWEQKEQTIKNTPVGTVILNVVTPTLAIFLPEKSKATGTGIIIAPGGACVALAMKEVDELANSLREKGIAAFVLKYRIKEKKEEGMPKDLNEDTACQYGIADAAHSIKLVREHSSQWGISPGKIGFVGFSAGGMIASEVMLAKDLSGRPDFVGLIYGAPFASMPVVPSNLPPIFMTWAADDVIAGYAMERFYKALLSVQQTPEVHIFSSGGHSFAAKRQGTTSDHWLEEFYYWLQAKGFAGEEVK